VALLRATLRAGDTKISQTLDLYSIVVATVQDISFWTGLATVFAFSQGRFSEKQGDEEETDPPLPNRYFTSRFRYYGSAALYSGVFAAIYCALIVVGSVPALQGNLKVIFGSLAGSAPSADDEIGTPAWAAMLVMVIAPAIPWVKKHEAALRLWLQEFSDIPFKARQLADETLSTLLASMNVDDGTDGADVPTLFELFARLELLQGRLGATGRPKLDQGYKRFFKEHSELLAKTKGKIKAMHAEFEAQQGAARPARANRRRQAEPDAGRIEPAAFREQLVQLVKRYARLLICAALWLEGEEYNVRETLRGAPHLTAFRTAEFRFTKGQVFLGLVAVTVAGLTVGAACDIALVAILTDEPKVTYFDVLDYRIVWALMESFAFILPLLFAAAIRLYLIDLRIHRGQALEWQTVCVAIILAFLACWGLAALPTVLVQTVKGAQAGVSLDLTFALLLAVPPAVVNASFVGLSGARLKLTKGRRALLDFATFGVIGGACAVLIFAFQQLRAGVDYPFLEGYAADIATIFVVSGLFGALQCSISRGIEASARRNPLAGADASGLGLRALPQA
jgi:hypothetical protein